MADDEKVGKWRRYRNAAYLIRKHARQEARRKQRRATDAEYCEKCRACGHAYYMEHRDKCREQARAHREANRDYYHKKNREYAARRALLPEAIAKREQRQQQRIEREQRLLAEAERRRLRHDPIEQKKRALARWRRARTTLRYREHKRMSDRKRAAERNAIFGALRELGWIKGLDLVMPVVPTAAAPLLLPSPEPKQELRLSESTPAALPGCFVAIDRQGVARIIAIRGKRGRPTLADPDATLRRNFLRARARSRKRGRPPLGLTEAEKAARKREQDRLRQKAKRDERRLQERAWRAANAHTAEFKTKRAEQGRRYRLKRDALLAAARELGLFEAQQQ